MAVPKPSVNVFALLESDDPGNTRLAAVGAQAKADAAAKRRPRKVYKKQEPQMSVWKKNKLKAEADAAARKKQQQLAAAFTNTNTTAGKNRKLQQPAVPRRAQVEFMTTANVGKNRKPQEPVVPSRAQVSTAAATAAMNMQPKQPAESKAHVNTTANADDDDKQFQQQPAARSNLLDQLFAYANSVRALIYKNRKQNGQANSKNAVAGDAPTDDKKGGRRLA